MILAGDIGGTKTNLGLFEVANGSLHKVSERSFPSKSFDGLELMVAEFLRDAGGPVVAACFGVAGPVIDGVSVTPNLAWDVNSSTLAESLGLKSVVLLNDLEATGYGVMELSAEEMLTLNEGSPEEGNAALIAAGTGLGVAGLFWDGRQHRPSPSEGGHIEFAPRNPLEIELLEYLLTQYSHVSVERVLSGPGLFNIYSFLRSAGYGPERAETAERFATEDPSVVISKEALAGTDELCVRALDMFAAIYGAMAGNVALLFKATAGVYVGGGIAPKIIEKLKGGEFMRAFTDKGRFSSLVESIPVRVILNDKTALLGAAHVAAKSSAAVTQ